MIQKRLFPGAFCWDHSVGTVAQQDNPPLPDPREVTPLTPTVRPVSPALQAKLSASSSVHMRAPIWGQALPLDGSHLACVASSSLRPPASRGGKRPEPKGAFEELDAPALSHRAQDEVPAFWSPQFQKDLLATQGCQGSLWTLAGALQAGWGVSWVSVETCSHCFPRTW